MVFTVPIYTIGKISECIFNLVGQVAFNSFIITADSNILNFLLVDKMTQYPQTFHHTHGKDIFAMRSCNVHSENSFPWHPNNHTNRVFHLSIKEIAIETEMMMK